MDFGGVLTTNVWDSFRLFCEAEDLDREQVKRAFRENPEAIALLRRLETGELTEQEFEQPFGDLLELPPQRHAGLVDRLFGGMGPDQAMIDALPRARAAGIRTGLISNSWGRGRYDRDLFPKLFDAVVISGEVGLHKPQAEIYELGAERVGLDAEECIFVDDLVENCDGAEAIGMTAILHRGAGETLARLEELLEVELS
ncbi:MAG: HAD family phosphatase [Solirubrobacterales bacterium]